MSTLPVRPFLCLALATVFVAGPTAADWIQLSSLPDREGFAGAFAGVSHGALLFAGGANFPDRKPWEGGRKIWYDTVYVLERADGEWQVAGTLAHPIGYGVSVTQGDRVVCAGGSDLTAHYADVFTLEWTDHRLVTNLLPRLPAPVANACGALVGETLYVAGGQARPDSTTALNAVYALDLAAPSLQWTTIAPCPGPGRILAAAAALDGAFYIVGGAELYAGADGKAARRYLRDAYRYDPRRGWSRIADAPRPTVAAPSPAPAYAGGFYLLGGDDGTQAGVAASRHMGFTKVIYRYDAGNGVWTQTGARPRPTVTAPCVIWNGAWVVPSGEVLPGIRTREVWALPAHLEDAR